MRSFRLNFPVALLALLVLGSCTTGPRPAVKPEKRPPILRLLGRVPTDKQPKQVCFHPTRDEFYVTNLGGAGPGGGGRLGPGSLQIFRLNQDETGAGQFEVLHREPARAAVECRLLKEDTLLYSDMFRDEVVVFDLNQRTVTHRIPIKGPEIKNIRGSGFRFMPKVIEPTPDGSRAFVSLWLGGVSLLDLNTGTYLKRSKKFCAHPRGLLYDAKTKLLNVMCYGIPDGKGQIVQLDGESLEVVNRKITGGSPRHVIPLSDGQALVGNLNNGRIEKYDPATASFTDGVRIGGAPNTIDADPWGHYLYISRRARNNVGIVDIETMRLVGEQRTGKFPTGLDVRADGKYLAVTNFHEASVDIFAIE